MQANKTWPRSLVRSWVVALPGFSRRKRRGQCVAKETLRVTRMASETNGSHRFVIAKRAFIWLGSAERDLAGGSAGGPARVASLFPVKREAKREVAKAWQAWPRNQTSSRSLVRSLVWVGRPWWGSTTAPIKNQGPNLKRNVVHTESKLAPFSSFRRFGGPPIKMKDGLRRGRATGPYVAIRGPSWGEWGRVAVPPEAVWTGQRQL